MAGNAGTAKEDRIHKAAVHTTPFEPVVGVVKCGESSPCTAKVQVPSTTVNLDEPGASKLDATIASGFSSSTCGRLCGRSALGSGPKPRRLARAWAQQSHDRLSEIPQKADIGL